VNPVVEYLLKVFFDDGNAFFTLANNILYIVAFGFIFVFSAVYLTIFIKFIIILNEEIWQTNGILNMIPMKILEKNQKVKEQVLNRKTIK